MEHPGPQPSATARLTRYRTALWAMQIDVGLHGRINERSVRKIADHLLLVCTQANFQLFVVLEEHGGCRADGLVPGHE